uniref:Ras association (RalGDS/AF-6) and pleckstrin homology domains 1a n=1 Tax=Hucho hucho TaxID=62062 RepID=A0A4W5LEC2_9TELE
MTVLMWTFPLLPEALNQGGDSVDLDSLMADLCSIEQELTTIGKPNAKLRQKPTAGTRASPASTVAARHGRPMASNLSLDDITAQLEQASLSMDEASRQSHSLASASSSASSSSRPASHHHTHRRTGSVGTVSEHEVRSISLSSRSSVNSASASSMDSLDRPSEQDGATPTQQGPNQGLPGNTEEEQAAKTKAEKIRVALEKIKEAQVKKVTHYRPCQSVLYYKTDAGQVIQCTNTLNCYQHTILHQNTLNWHQNVMLHQNTLNWPENTLNWHQNNYLLGRKETCEMADRNKEALLEECFCGSAVSVPEMEGVLWLKEDGKKSWKKRYFLLRASGIYYVPKGKAKASRELVCFLQLDHVNVYNGQEYRGKYKAPTDYCLALKHPQIQRKSQYIKYLCCDDVRTLHQWINGIRIAKYGKTLYVNYLEAMKRTEAAYDWSSLSSSSIKSGSSSSSLPGEWWWTDTHLQHNTQYSRAEKSYILLTPLSLSLSPSLSLSAKPRWQPGGQIPPQSPEFPLPPPLPPSKMGSPIKKSPSTSSTGSFGKRGPPPTPQRASSIKSNSSGEYQEEVQVQRQPKKVESLVSKFAQPGLGSCNSFTATSSGYPALPAPPKPGKLNLSALPLVLQGLQTGQHRQPNFPSPPQVAVVNPQPQSSWKTQSLKKTPPLTLHRLSRSNTVQEPLPLSPPPFACPLPPTSPGVPKGGGTLSSVQPNFLEDLNRTLKRKSISRHGSLTRHGSSRLEPVSMDDMALPPPPPPDQRRGGQGGDHGYMSSGYATLRRGPRPAPPKRDESTKLTGEW